jgi:hypothetical protein
MERMSLVLRANKHDSETEARKRTTSINAGVSGRALERNSSMRPLSKQPYIRGPARRRESMRITASSSCRLITFLYVLRVVILQGNGALCCLMRSDSALREVRASEP